MTALFWMILVSTLAGLRDRFYTWAQFQRVQDQKLRNLVRHAKANVPLYRDTLRNVDPENFRLTDLPVINKRILMERFDESTVDPAVTLAGIETWARDKSHIGTYYLGKYVVCMTSGTTGLVGYYLNDPKTWGVLRGCEFARLLRHRLSIWQILRFSFGRRLRWAMLVAMGGFYITYMLVRMNPWATRLLANVKTFSIMEKLDVIVAQLNVFKPHLIHGYPTFLEALAHEQMAGRLKIDPEFISSGSEPFTARCRNTLKKAFKNAQLSETYGTTEFLALANQCAHGRLHVNSDYVIVEPVDDLYRPVPEGTPSRKILITNLANVTQPLIRYEMTDSVVFTGEKCPCGCALPVVEVQGRTDDTFYFKLPDGTFKPHPPIPFEVLFLQVEGLRQYQLIHEEQNRLRIRFAPAHNAGEDEVRNRLLAQFRGYFQEHGLDSHVQIDVELIRGDLTRNPSSQKVRQIYSKVPAPEITESTA